MNIVRYFYSKTLLQQDNVNNDINMLSSSCGAISTDILDPLSPPNYRA